MILRGLVGGAEAALRTRQLAHGRMRAAAPDLLYAEVVNGLVKYVRNGEITPLEAGSMLEYVAALPLESTPCTELADEALRIAVERGVSAYDAMYIALAEATDGTLVTADRPLATAADRVELIED